VGGQYTFQEQGKGIYFKDKTNELEPNSNNKNIRDLYRDINKFKECYHP
jgi:hypothetical protein